jgi:hypothetical protein
MLAYAILITAGFSQAAGLYLAIVTDMFDIDLPLPALGFLELPFMLFGCFLLGRWIGYRCAKFGLVVAAIAPALCIVADRLFLLLVFGSDEDVQRFLGTGFSYKFLYTTFGGIALYATVAALGFWRGRVRRLARYMAYMFAVLPSDTQEALIGLTHEEITTRFMRPTQPVSPR